MTKKPRYARTSALSAIAAALALTSTAGMTQEVQPAPTAPTTQPAPDMTPPATDTAPATEATPTTVDSTATDSTTPDASTADTAPAKAKRTAPKRTAAPPVAKSHPVPQATHAPAAIASAPAAPPAKVSAPATAPAAAPTATAAAINDAASNPAPVPKAAPAKTTTGNNDMMLELGGGALALLALGGAAFAFSRRRGHEEEELWHDEQVMEPVANEPISTVEPAPTVQPRHDRIVEEQPALVAPAASAFAWGPRESNKADDDGSDRRPGESWIERAYRGPSPANPSVSLKNRLRRAAFFDKRERDVAAGTAEPVDTDAGLPDAMVEDREFA